MGVLVICVLVFIVFCIIWCFSDRASQYRLVSITNVMHNSFIL